MLISLSIKHFTYLMDGCFRKVTTKQFIDGYVNHLLNDDNVKRLVNEEDSEIKCVVKKFIQYKNRNSAYFFENDAEVDISALTILVDIMFHRLWNNRQSDIVIMKLNKKIQKQLTNPESDLTAYKLKHLNGSLKLFEQIQQRFSKLKNAPEIDFGSSDKIITIQF